MPWTERQIALLGGLGLRVWSPPADAAPVTVDAPVAPAAAAAPAEAVAEAPASAMRRPAASPAAPTAPTSPVLERVPGPERRPAADRPAVLAPPRVRPASPVDALDWPALEAAVAGCSACGLCETRTQTVFGVGHRQAHWMVVGEAPGEQEDRRGEPFVGPAGQLLDAMLAALGLSREADGAPDQRVFIANTLKCRPPRNRNPAPEELAACEPFLLRQLALVKPRIILAMGRFAIQQLLGSDRPVGQLRGRVHRYEGVPLVVTYHPAYLLRSPAEKARAWEDLCLAAATAEAAGGG